MNKFRLIYLDIEEKIKNHEYPVGSLLPSENQLSKYYKVSRETIRKALSLLSDNGFIFKKQGVGSTVLDYQRFALPISGLVSYKELYTSLEIENITTVIENRIIPAPKFLTDLVALDADETFIYLVRTRKLADEVLIVDEDYIRTKLVGSIPNDIAENSIYEYFEGELGLEIGYAVKEFTAEKATDLDIKHLGIQPTDWTITVKNEVFLEDTTFFQYTISHHRLDRFRFQEFAARNSPIAKF